VTQNQRVTYDRTVSEAQETIAGRLRWQADWCKRLGSPLYAELLEAAARDVETGGAAWELLAGREREPAQAFLALRLLGSVHRLVLMGSLPELAPFYPSAGGSVDLHRAPRVFLDTLGRHTAEIREHLDRPVQTNEVGRCAGLLGGFLQVGYETGLPLAVLEVGASAGLNLRFDRFRYSSGRAVWGDPASAVRFDDVFESSTPHADATLQVVERRGCDRSPLDPRSEEDRLTLMSYVWPDQGGRFDRLRAALKIAAEDPIAVERASAAEWTGRVLAEPRPEMATVLFHSVVLPYLSPDEGSAFHRELTSAGERATPEAPFAWLSLEPGEKEADVRLTLWPGGEERLLAQAGFHSTRVRWLADQSAGRLAST
jgi:hypothetical protein